MNTDFIHGSDLNPCESVAKPSLPLVRTLNEENSWPRASSSARIDSGGAFRPAIGPTAQSFPDKTRTHTRFPVYGFECWPGYPVRWRSPNYTAIAVHAVVHQEHCSQVLDCLMGEPLVSAAEFVYRFSAC